MKITKSQLKQIIKEEMEISLKETYKGFHSKQDYEQTLSGGGEMPDTTSKIHMNPKLAGKPESWLPIADRLEQMSRVWVDPEDGKMLHLAGAILRSAFEQSNAELEATIQGAGALELPGAPSTKSLDHQRRRKFRRP